MFTDNNDLLHTPGTQVHIAFEQHNLLTF